MTLSLGTYPATGLALARTKQPQRCAASAPGTPLCAAMLKAATCAQSAVQSTANPIRFQ